MNHKEQSKLKSTINEIEEVIEALELYVRNLKDTARELYKIKERNSDRDFDLATSNFVTRVSDILGDYNEELNENAQEIVSNLYVINDIVNDYQNRA